jgi:predicted dehydrogenase
LRGAGAQHEKLKNLLETSTKLKWGLIGCGDIARKRIAPALRDSAVCELVAVSRAQSHLAESFAHEFGAHRWYASWQELLLDREIEAVYIATPVHLHEPQTIAAAEAGKHVLCEKPMALNVDECARMIDACRVNHVKLGVAYYRHFYPAITRIKAIIASGEIGKPILAQINAFEWFNPPPNHPRAWLIDGDRAGGGPMFDFGCHRIEVLLHLLGQIKEVKGVSERVLFDREVEDTAAALFVFASGACGILSVSHAALEPQDNLQIFGSKGSVHVPILNQGTIHIVTSDNKRTESCPAANNLHQPLIEDFVAAVLDNREATVSGTDGRAVAQVVADIYASGL